MEKGGYSLGEVAFRSAARSGGIGIDRRMNGFQPAATPFGLEGGGWRSLGRVGTCSRVHRLD